MKLSEIKNKVIFAKGKRGVIYKGKYKNKKVSVKKQRKDIPVTWSIKNESEKLKILNKKGIGPKLLTSGKDYIVYEFVEGVFIPEFIKKQSKEKIKSVLLECLMQCFVMDKMNLNKEELTNPYKHILIKEQKERCSLTFKVTMLDFERCKETKKPKNVTQFLQYLMSSRASGILKLKGFKINKKNIINNAKKYKKNITRENFNKIIKLL